MGKPPQARFLYDLAPVEVLTTHEREQTWYGCATSLLAIVGGAFTTLGIFARSGGAVARTVRRRRAGQ